DEIINLIWGVDDLVNAANSLDANSNWLDNGVDFAVGVIAAKSKRWKMAGEAVTDTVRKLDKLGDTVPSGVTKGPIQHTKHSLNQKINREVKSADELDAVRNPLKNTEVKYDSQGRPSEKFIGENATVAVNPETGKIVTVHPTSSKLAERLKRQQGDE
ncbi:hypothetical protein V9N52_004371, partial [Vibrio navarrensis]